MTLQCLISQRKTSAGVTPESKACPHPDAVHLVKASQREFYLHHSINGAWFGGWSLHLIYKVCGGSGEMIPASGSESGDARSHLLDLIKWRRFMFVPTRTRCGPTGASHLSTVSKNPTGISPLSSSAWGGERKENTLLHFFFHFTLKCFVGEDRRQQTCDLNFYRRQKRHSTYE